MQKRVCVINDISCEGRCSVTAALPVYAAAGIHGNIIPTALLSTQTGGYSGYSYLDLSGEMLKIAMHFKSLGLHFDVLYTGYLASKEQIQTVMETVDILSHDVLIVDPVMGDEGRLYDGFDNGYCEEMKKLCVKADIIVPNLTEACLLTDNEYGRKNDEDIRDIARALQNICRGKAVITGLKKVSGNGQNDHIGIAVCNGADVYTEFYPEENGVYHGAGDVFGAVLTCGIAHNRDMSFAARLAHDFVREAIKITKASKSDTRQGLMFEPCLKRLIDEYVV